NNSNIPPIFPENDQFNGKNFTAFKTRLLIAAKARGYLEGATYNINTTTDTAPTPWTSLTPSTDEWEVRDAWALGLVIFNVKNPIGLGVRIDGTAAQAWASLNELYNITSDLALVNAE
ncbi:hypothetical protein BDZ94DRAFT_1172407, partial [Collybia nuda]